MGDESAAASATAGPAGPGGSAAKEAMAGPNAWLVDDMYERYAEDPSSVAESWRDFFEGYRAASPARPDNGASPAAAPVVAPTPAAPADGEGQPLRGAAARLAANMEASLAVPTATSTRVVPARLLEVNRKVINGYLGRTGGGRVSVTHLVGWAVVKATETVPAMRQSFACDAEHPAVVRHHHVGLGVAVDVERDDGSRALLVPCIRDADNLDFR